MTEEMTEDTEWMFETGDIIREEQEQMAAGGVSLGKTEYRIELKLRDEEDGKRFYHVEKQEGGTHLYSARAIEPMYETISESESQHWPRD